MTKTHGEESVCYTGFQILDSQNKEVTLNVASYDDTGIWSKEDSADNALKYTYGYYCSDKKGFDSNGFHKDGESEVVTFTLEDSIAEFPKFEIQQADGMGYNPKDWTLEAFDENDGQWVVIYETTNFDFNREDEILTLSSISFIYHSFLCLVGAEIVVDF